LPVHSPCCFNKVSFHISLLGLATALPFDYSGAATNGSTPITSAIQYSNLVAVQAFIWIPILLIITVGCTVCTMISMDADKSKDTLVYAKFLANVKDK
jgi:hypothetical protein